jgi:hypothetical protein
MVCVKSDFDFDSDTSACIICDALEANISTEKRFVQCLFIVYPWMFEFLDVQKASLAQALLVLTAGSNSLLILEYLLVSKKD